MSDDYCASGADGPAGESRGALDAAGQDGSYAECVLCREPTEYPESYKGITLCPVCDWQEAQRTACSG
ncbi:hypothetical protein AB0F46_12600 [Streptomyces sp. NPDC026665]|uniref:hypothetical protein n=1 Tax=Streptomyces sp. NPDC026665 TaxID=3154798 RepID=UPI0033D77FBD